MVVFFCLIIITNYLYIIYNKKIKRLCERKGINLFINHIEVKKRKKSDQKEVIIKNH